MIDINCDVGEGMDNEQLLFPHISSCNIACGGHAGDKVSMEKVLSLAKQYDVKVGAHPSYPDKVNFGRVSMELSPSELAIRLIDQISTLEKLAINVGLELNHIKAHGALYNDLMRNESLAITYLEALSPYQDIVSLYLPFGSVAAKLAEERGFSIVLEAFADRRYNDDLSLALRQESGAVLTDPSEIIEQVDKIENDQKILTSRGKLIELRASTYCVHSDTKNAVEIVRALSQRFNKAFEPIFKHFGQNSALIEWPARMDEQILDDMLHYIQKLDHFLAEDDYEFVQSVHSILVTSQAMSNFEPKKAFHNDWISHLQKLYTKDFPVATNARYLFKIPVCYSKEYGPDLSIISEANDISIQEVIGVHTQKEYRVFSIGFLPGFLYLGGLDEKLHIDRKAQPRLKVPKGAVGIGGSQTGIYPQESPGGWQLIGQTPLSLFDVSLNHPCFAKAGDKIQFFAISAEEYLQLEIQIADGTYLIEKEVIND